jgi:hypothetical protein
VIGALTALRRHRAARARQRLAAQDRHRLCGLSRS